MDMGDDDDNIVQPPQPLPPVPRSLFDERRRRLAALQAAMWAQHAAMTDETWACLIQSLAVYHRACGLLADVDEVEARIHASRRTAAKQVERQHEHH
jgi:hypothetical protein